MSRHAHVEMFLGLGAVSRLCEKVGCPEPEIQDPDGIAYGIGIAQVKAICEWAKGIDERAEEYGMVRLNRDDLDAYVVAEMIRDHAISYINKASYNLNVQEMIDRKPLARNVRKRALRKATKAYRLTFA